jgi:hypothetical protein
MVRKQNRQVVAVAVRVESRIGQEGWQRLYNLLLPFSILPP